MTCRVSDIYRIFSNVSWDIKKDGKGQAEDGSQVAHRTIFQGQSVWQQSLTDYGEVGESEGVELMFIRDQPRKLVTPVTVE